MTENLTYAHLFNLLWAIVTAEVCNKEHTAVQDAVQVTAADCSTSGSPQK